MRNFNSNKQQQLPSWINIIAKYNKPITLKSIWQIINSVIPFISLWVLMFYSIQVSYWLTLLLSIFSAGFLIRIFIIFHDCVHGAFFRKRKYNKMVGVVLGLFAFTSFHKWQNDHLIHHNTVGNLDKRGTGDVKTLTVEEYLNSTKWQRLKYRIYRHPIFLFGIAPLLHFAIQNRLPKKELPSKIKRYIYFTNLALITLITGLILLIGWKIYLLIQLPVLYIATSHGIWLFYVQHQFEGVVWTNTTNWDYKTMALEGSSYFKLPILLQWFTGNIGFHHIHHLSPLIPFYNLPKCHKENTLFQTAKTITFFSSLKSLKMNLWDEKKQKLVNFKDIAPLLN
jgi:omega-6 fatty acid desaturase (delta-12 desaturase)